MLNRSAVVVRYREAFRDWLRSVGVEEEEFQDHGEKSVYLIGECDYPEDQAAVLVFKGGMVQIMLPKKAVPGERDVTESGSQAEAPTSHRYAAWH